MEAVRSLRNINDRLSLVVADGYDVSKVEAMVGVISNPLAAADSLSSPDEHKHFGYDSDRSSVRVSLNEKVGVTSLSPHDCACLLYNCNPRSAMKPVLYYFHWGETSLTRYSSNIYCRNF